MDTIICGTSAIEYWRVPPLVNLLACGDEDDPRLRPLAPAEAILAARAAAFEASELGTKLLRGGRAWNHAGKAALRLAEAAPALCHALSLPINVLVSERRGMHASELVKPRLWSTSMPLGGCAEIGDGLWVQRPEFALLQLAGSGPFGMFAMLLAEFLGTYSVYRLPPAYTPILVGIQRGGADRRLSRELGWSQVTTRDGGLSGLWKRPQACRHEEIARFSSIADTRRGADRLERALASIPEGAASPFEAKAGLLLALPPSLGGEGHEGMEFNARIDLTREASLLAKRGCCYADLYWEDSDLDLECQSSLAHDGEAAYLSDADRAAALACMGVRTLPVTYGQLADAARFKALSATVAGLRGTRPREKGSGEARAAQQLRSELFGGSC